MIVRTNELGKTQKITISAMVMALYVVIMYFTQSFAFGEYQIRIATALYSLSCLLPFLVLPLGMSNLISNMVMGGMGLPDILGGFAVGIVTAGLCWLIGKYNMKPWLVAIPIILVPGLGVAIWLSAILGIPYFVMAGQLLLGQIVPGILGAVITTTMKGRLFQ